MIIKAEIINIPYSGQYTERIYNIESGWNFQDWTFIKFTNDDCFEWCGHFRGFPKQIVISTVYNNILVLTSDYLFQLDIKTGDLIEFEEQPQHINLTIAPNGSFIISDYYNIEKITTNIKQKIKIEGPVLMDMIEFKDWNNNKLEFICNEFLNWDRHLVMEYDSETNRIEIKK